uniref:Ig-like domain-containing protein n=1 Tax=Gopherus agassizii TaxID=38772 RepID=A0A452GMH7_9SAUR
MGKKRAERITGFLGLQPPALGLGGFLGLALTACFLSTDPSLPRPNISLSPTGVTAPGADVTIRCQGQRWDLRFFLHKAGDLNPQQHMDTAGAGAEFRIPSVSRQQEGNYSCSYRPRSEPFVCSQPSEIVQLVVVGEDYSKPNISGIPSGGVSLGAVVTICCEGQHRGVRFVLNKEQRHYPPVDSDGFGAEFLISNVSREDSGNYSCSYHSKSEPFAVSYPSDPVELVVRGEGPGSASLFPAPSWGAVGRSGIEPSTGNSQGLRPGLPQPSTSQSPLHPGGLWLLPLSSPQPLCFRAGHLISPAPSPLHPLSSLQLRYPKSNISLRPSGGVAQGEAVTIWCVCQCLGVRFLLRKGGAMAAHRTTAPAVDVVEFPICNVRRGDAGSYCCRYRTKWDPLISSEPSDPMELAGEGSGLASLLPAPLSVEPGRVCICAQGLAGLILPFWDPGGAEPAQIPEFHPLPKEASSARGRATIAGCGEENFLYN